MIRQSFRYLSKHSKIFFAWLTLLAFLTSSAVPAAAVMSATQGGALPQPLPLFPADNWWNLDISSLASRCEFTKLHQFRRYFAPASS